MCGHGPTGIPDVLPEALNAWNAMPHMVRLCAKSTTEHVDLVCIEFSVKSAAKNANKMKNWAKKCFSARSVVVVVAVVVAVDR